VPEGFEGEFRDKKKAVTSKSGKREEASLIRLEKESPMQERARAKAWGSPKAFRKVKNSNKGRGDAFPGRGIHSEWQGRKGSYQSLERI